MTFSDIDLIEPLLRALQAEGYLEPTPIQSQAIPKILAGHDLLGIAQTGTGKTAAFSLPLLQLLWTNDKVSPSFTPRALILAPTRELAAQIGDSLKTYGKYLDLHHAVIFGGVGQNPQVRALERGVDVLVATPGRLLDLMNQGYVSLAQIEFLVLDEADRMLDMGFIHDIRRILSKVPKERQTLFFSATMPPEVTKLAQGILKDPVRIEVTPQSTPVERITQGVLFVDQQQKEALLIDLLQSKHLSRVLVFTKTKHRANKLAKTLNSKGIRADAIHGNKSQTARTQALSAFQSGHCRVLVATDIAARGIDVESISHVINFDLPNEPENYVHRIGRTARAGAEGTAYSLCSAEEQYLLQAVQRVTKITIPVVQHHFHSERAQHAKGVQAKPNPKPGRKGWKDFHRSKRK